MRTLALRLGINCHVSPLLFKVRRLAEKYPARDSGGIEDRLARVANARGARCVMPLTPASEYEMLETTQGKIAGFVEYPITVNCEP